MSNSTHLVSELNDPSEHPALANGPETERDTDAVSGKVRARLKRAKQRAADAQVIVIEKGRKSARAANDYAHDRPWTTAGVALGIGVLVGLLIGRK
ncbi:ElaB/YgaM/YqjD family protein [Paraburkholderia dilworthii]|uniref:DUF883 domain-containing protein n=1 Tax=Paraburkholderia dilworthii TaxID=948106 RepID=A0ABW9D342_9BURK